MSERKKEKRKPPLELCAPLLSAYNGSTSASISLPHPDDNLHSEEFDLGQDVSASSLSAMFAGGGSQDFDIDIDEDEDAPSPMFGPLSGDDDDVRPAISDPGNVFDPHGEDDEYEVGPDRGRGPIRPGHDLIDLDEYAGEEYETGEKKLTWRDKKAIAKKSLKEDTAKPAKTPKKQTHSQPAAPSDDFTRVGDEEVSPAKQPKLSMKERLALAKAEATKSKKQSEAPAPEQDDDASYTFDMEDDEPEAVKPQAPAPKKKMSFSERMAIARGNAPSADIVVDNSFADDSQDTSLDDIDDDLPLVDLSDYESEDEVIPEPKAKLSIRERIAQAKALEESKPKKIPAAQMPQTPVVNAPKAPVLPSQPTPEKAGFWASRKAMLEQAQDAPKKSKKAQKQALAGVDASAPSALTLFRDKVVPTSSSSFGEILTPVTGDALRRLQLEIQEDETPVMIIARANKLGHMRQNVGFIVGLLCLLFFFYGVGTQYLSDTLVNAPLPSALDDLNDKMTDVAQGVLVGLGMLLPLMGAAIVAEAVKYLWRGLDDKRIDDMLLGALATICAGGVFVPLQTGEVLASAGFLLAWIFARAVIRTLSRILKGGE